MNLSDQEILELNDLFSALVDGTLTEAQKTRLSERLATSEEARKFYVRYAGLSASLCQYAGEMQSEEPDLVRAPSRIIRPAAWWWSLGSLAAAALVMFALWIFKFSNRDDSAPELDTGDIVARLSGSKNCVWTGRPAPRPGDVLRRGQRLDLAGGFAEVTFDCGAQVLLEGPALLDLDSAWEATLRRGTLRADVPAEAVGFRISNPAVEVVDLGTKFSMIADEHGGTEVFVLKGSVEAAPTPAAGTNREACVLREKEARRFSDLGMSDVRDRERKLARLSQSIVLDHVAGRVGYVHWSFDEPGGDVARAEVLGLAAGACDAQLVSLPATPAGAGRTEGRWQRALQFDGQFYAKAAFPGISTNLFATVAFWVKVPADAPLPGGCDMVAWHSKALKKPNPKKTTARIVQIGWNRNPEQGALGALRTELGRYAVIGSTSLRDGRWHHVAVVFMPVGRADKFVHVRQYVDGRLEETTSSSAKQKRVTPAEEITATADDRVWLGRRLGGPGQRQDRFHGAMDELFIADRALAPDEITHLMTDNKPLLPEWLAAKSGP